MTNLYTKNIKECFIPRDKDNNIFICCDFSQLEICGLAELTGDTILINELNSGVDIHSSNAAIWKKKPIAEVLAKERKDAKVITFQLQYGAGTEKISKSLDIPTLEASNFIDIFYSKYKRVHKFHEELRKYRNAEGQPKDINDYLVLNSIISGHPMARNYIIKAKEYNGKLYYPLTEMKNYPIQGFSTGDLVPLVINRIMDCICNIDIFNIDFKPILVSTVHDDFTIELHSEDLYKVLSVIEEVFRELHRYFKILFDYELKVNYNYDIKIGSNFASMEKITRKEVQNLLINEVNK